MNDEDVHLSIADRLTHHLAGRMVVLLGTRSSDTTRWHRLLHSAGTRQALVLTFDDAPLRPLLAQSPATGATDLLARQHGLIATLDQPSTLSRLVDQFDPGGRAVLVFTDPLDPPTWGGRSQLGAKHPSWRLFEHKATVDTLWDTMGIRRAETVVFDHPASLPMGEFAFATGTVWACQRRGSGPTTGADGIRWSRSPSPPAHPNVAAVSQRVRAMPLLPGRSCRLHGLVFADRVAVFPPLELVVLSRPETESFLCAGSVPLAGHTELSQLTTTIGSGLRDHLGYRGGFAVDGILAPEGFLPTDLNTRLTSAFEAANTEARVALHAANLLARLDDTSLATACTRLASRATEATPEITLFGATQERPHRASGQQPVQWRDGHLRPVTSEDTKDGVLTISPSPRGWTMTATLSRRSIPADLPAASVALEAFRASDATFGTRFGRLDIPAASPRPSTTDRRKRVSGQLRQCRP